MPSPVPTPVAAALGLVPTVFRGVRRVPGRVVQLPILAVSSALAGLDLARREYDDLAARGERLIARLRGTSFDELEDRFEDSLKGTPLAGPYDAVEDALEDVGEAAAKAAGKAARRTRGTTRAVSRTADDAAGGVADLGQRTRARAGKAAAATAEAADEAAATAGETTAKAADKAEEKATQAADTAQQAAGTAADTAQQAAGSVADTAERAAGTAADTAQQAAGTAADTAQQAAGSVADAAQQVTGTTETTPDAEQPKGEPTPKASQPDDTRVDTAASADVVETVEQVSAQTRSSEVPEHDDLPLPDYDHMTLGSLRGRLRSLTTEQLVQLRDYEKAHANRLPVVTMLDNRIAKLASDGSQEPSGVPSDRPAPGQRRSRKGSKVSPATGGPAQNPPSQGVPTNPAQPRTTGSPGTNPNSDA